MSENITKDFTKSCRGVFHLQQLHSNPILTCQTSDVRCFFCQPGCAAAASQARICSKSSLIAVLACTINGIWKCCVRYLGSAISSNTIHLYVHHWVVTRQGEGDLKILSIETLLASLLALMPRFLADNVEVCSLGSPSLLINFRITRIVRRVSSVRDFRGQFVERRMLK